MALPDHFTEPSGHDASVQVWTGTDLPSAVRMADGVGFFQRALRPRHAPANAFRRGGRGAVQPFERDARRGVSGANNSEIQRKRRDGGETAECEFIFHGAVIV